jgi:hypothetical protein
MASEHSINDLWQNVREHPDFAGGTVFTRQDVADSVYEPPGGWNGGQASPELVSRLTDEQVSAAIEAIRSFIFDEQLEHTWRDALRRGVSPS